MIGRREVRRARLPEGLEAHAKAAEERLLARRAPPRIKIEKLRKRWRFSSPYSRHDESHWHALLCDAFGTRHGGVLDHFLERITELVPEGKWDGEKRYWLPSESDFNAVLAIISALQPDNEAQAAHAAQLAALHLSAMKLGEHAARWGSERTIATLAKTTRAYGEGLERLARLQGKVEPKQVNQTIQVVYVDNRNPRGVQPTGGVSPIGGQPHGTDGSTLVPRPTLPSPCPDRTAVPVPRGEGQTSLPDSWWGARFWRTLWRAKR